MESLPVFSTSARRALALARESAAAQGARAVGADHVLLGLLGEPTGEVRALVPPEVRIAYGIGGQAESVTPAADPGAGAELPYTASSKRAIIAAGSESARGGAAMVTPRHVLIALVLDPDTDVGRALRAAGLSPERLREQ
jgi:ATP-dependent Clp protease ATP-binding subunit ClpC